MLVVPRKTNPRAPQSLNMSLLKSLLLSNVNALLLANEFGPCEYSKLALKLEFRNQSFVTNRHSFFVFKSLFAIVISDNTATSS